jgi:cell division protein FtsB
MTKIKAAFLEGDTKYHISRPGGGPACNADAYFPYSNKTELPRKSVCKNCLRSSMAEYEEIPKHIAEIPDGYRIMKVGEVITHETMYWAWDAGPWTPYGDNKEPGFQVGDVLRCDEDHQPFPHCCPVDLQETQETSDNADSGEPVSDKEYHGGFATPEERYRLQDRIADLEKQVAELNAANDELNEDDAKQVQLIGKLEKERDKLERKVAQLIAIDKRVTDYIDDLCREHETEVNELKRKLDASSEASTHERTTVNLLTEKLVKAEGVREYLESTIERLRAEK